MIEIENLYKNYQEFQVLKDISFTIEKGEIFGIIGRSGAGKSTLLRCINGLEGYDKGKVSVMGKEIASLKEKDLRNLRKDLGMIFQSFNLFERKNLCLYRGKLCKSGLKCKGNYGDLHRI